MSTTENVTLPVSARIWGLAKKDPLNADLLRQAYCVIEVQKAILGQVVRHACALGYEGNGIEGACAFLQRLAKDPHVVGLIRQKTRTLAPARQNLITP